MTLTNTLRRHFAALVLPLLVAPACWSAPNCNVDLDSCESDADCPDGQLCATQAFSFGLECVDAIPCNLDTDCPDGGTCKDSDANQPDHPFELGLPARGICDCDGWYCQRDEGSVSSSTSTSASSGGAGGEGGEGNGGAGAGGEGGGL